MELRPRTTPDLSKSINIKSSFTLKRTDLLLNLTFNLSKGHYNFVTEILKSKLYDQNDIFININVNDTLDFDHLKSETNNSNKKFLLGKTPLILCSYLREKNWAISLTHLLLQNGANICQRDTFNGCSSLHYACAFLRTEIIEFFLRNMNQNINYLKDNNGNSPIFYLIASYACSLNTKEKQTSLDTKVLKTFKIYFNYLKHFNLKINTSNQNGLSLFRLLEFITSNNKYLLQNSVFKFIFEAILEEDPSIDNKSFENKNTGPVDLKITTSYDYYKLSSKTSIEIFLKRHLLIDLKNFKNINHSVKTDNYLILMYLNKVSPNNLPVNFYLIRNETNLEQNMEIYRKNIQIPITFGQNFIRPSTERKFFINDSSNWRYKFSQLYNSLEIKHSDSYRKSATCFFELHKELYSSPNNNSNHHYQNHNHQHHQLHHHQNHHQNHHQHHQNHHQNHHQHHHQNSNKHSQNIQDNSHNIHKSDTFNPILGKKHKNHFLIRK